MTFDAVNFQLSNQSASGRCFIFKTPMSGYRHRFEKTKLRIFRRPGWERRIVFFDGTVLLDAARNGLPFRIFADKATLTLQNARFEMCRWDNGTITLHVLKGPVMLTGPVPGRADETLKMTLRDNDSVTFRTEGEHLIIT